MILFIEILLRILFAALFAVAIAFCIWAGGFIATGAAFSYRREATLWDYLWTGACGLLIIVFFIEFYLNL